ncbi:MAG: hypothetical protein H3C47_01630 [Candidatus Cloacimonetes bacterium]|nr:hypothetical protein [Candidatus Cloacimonadota bacterium]
MSTRPNCYQCRYFRITWQSQFPYACGYFGFKGKMLPSTTVKQTNGVECGAFMDKTNSNPSTPAKTPPKGPPQPGTILKLPGKNLIKPPKR